jgi:hypothetical protein
MSARGLNGSVAIEIQLPFYPPRADITDETDHVGFVPIFVAEVGDDDGGAAARTRLLMQWSAICCTGSG